MPTLQELAEKAKSAPARTKAQPDAEEELLAIPKGERSAVVLRKLTQAGETFYDLRTFVFNRDRGCFVPTPKGIRLTKDQFNALVDFVRENASW